MTDIDREDAREVPAAEATEGGRAAGHRRSPAKRQATGAGKATTRQEQLRKLLASRSGADIAAISARFGWQPHSARAAITGLRKAGHAIVVEKGANGKATRYRLAPPAASVEAAE